MAGGGHCAAGIFRRNLPQGRQHPAADLGIGLRLVRVPQVRALVEVYVHLPVHAQYFAPGHLLPYAQAQLPQQGQGAEGQVFGGVDGGGSGVGPGQVAAVHGVDALVLEALAQIGQLPVSAGGDGAVVLSVGQAVEVALRLSVTDEKNFGRHNPRLLF